MSPLTLVTGIQIAQFVFPSSVKPPGTTSYLFLGGAGARGMEIDGKFVKFTAIGVYLEENAVAALAGKWKGKTADELADSVDFFADIAAGPFEKFTQVIMIKPLTGQQYTEKVSENCVAIWKKLGIYTEAEEKAIQKFKEVFEPEKFPPGASILFTHSPSGSLTISFSKSCCLPEDGNAVIENRKLSQAILMSIIGEHGVSPEAKLSLAKRMFDLFK
jgi:chalcone isomerase